MTDTFERLKAALADRYKIERELGSGGMATVYLAEDVKHERKVAVKVLRSDIAESLGAERFLREIKIAAQLHHPHILPLHDSGEADGFLFYVMPYEKGQSLRDKLAAEGELPVRDAVRILRDVADALAHAHTAGVVHRDIKPDNVMLSGRHALVTDFGVAKAVSEATGRNQITTAGVALGTPAYMAPEQAAADPHVDHRADIYALGALGYELLAGRPPFTGGTSQGILAAHVTEMPEPVTKHRAAVSPALAQVIMKCLEKKPADRWQNCEELLDLLEGMATPSGGMKGTTATGTPEGVAPTPQPEGRAGKSVAVLPFVNMSPDPENEYFSDGITEELINALSKLRGLQVASRSISFALKGKGLDVREIGRTLGVATVLEGSVRKAGNRLRIMAQLTNAADGYQLWSERYDREMEDVFAIQDQIAENIVQALRVVLSEDEKRAIEKVPTAHVQAYEYYLRGRQFFHQFRKKSLLFARRMFSRAIEIDSNFALAHAGVADCCSFLYLWWEASQANLEQAEGASRKALELDSDLAEAHTARGVAVSLNKQYDEAEREFETAIRLNPKLYEAHYFYGRTSLQQGKAQEAVEQFGQASQIRPDDYQAPFFVAQSLHAVGDEQRAHEALQRALEVTETYLELNSDDARAYYLGASCLAQLGEPSKSGEWLDRALHIDPEDAAVLYNVACVYVHNGELERAITCLEHAVENGFGHKEWLEHDPDFDPLRKEARFSALLEKF